MDSETWFAKTKSLRDAVLDKFGTHQDEIENFNSYLPEILELCKAHIRLTHLNKKTDSLHRIFLENPRFIKPFESGYGLDNPERALLRGNYESNIRVDVVYVISRDPDGTISNENVDYEYESEEEEGFRFQQTEIHQLLKKYHVEVYRKTNYNHLLCEVPSFTNSNLCHLNSNFQVPLMATRNYLRMPVYCLGGNFKICPSEEYYTNNRMLVKDANEIQLRCRFYDINKRYRTNNTFNFSIAQTKIQNIVTNRFVFYIPHEKPPRPIPVMVLAMGFGWTPDLFLRATRFYLSRVIPNANSCKKCQIFLDHLVQDRMHCETQRDALICISKFFAKCEKQSSMKDRLSYVSFYLHSEFLANLSEKNGAQDQFLKENIRKGDWLAQIAAEFILLSPLLNKLQPSNLKSYQFKNVTTPGSMLAALMRKFLKNLEQKAKKKFEECVDKNLPIDLNVVLSRKHIMVTNAVKKGDWDVHQTSSDSSKNKTHVVTMGFCIDSAHVQCQKLVKPAMSKNTNAAKLMIHPSVQGRIDGYTTPFTEKASVVRFKSLGSVISYPINMFNVNHLILSVLTRISGFHILQQHYPSVEETEYTSVYDIYGGIIGWIEDAHQLYKTFRDLRRSGVLPKYLRLEMDSIRKRFYFNCDEGRLLRPLIIVERIPELVKWLDQLDDFIQPLHFLVVNGFIEYLDANEEFCGVCLVADHIERLTRDSHIPFTHLEIDGCFSLTRTAGKAFANCNQGPRRVQTSNMENRSVSLKLNPDAGTTQSLSLWYAQDPIHSDPGNQSLKARNTEPNSYNLRVALFPTADMEDSMTINRTTIDLGILNNSKLHFHNVQLQENCFFGKPDHTVHGKGDEYRYRNLDARGILIVGSHVSYNDCIAGIIYEVKERKKVKHTRCRSEFLPYFRIYRVCKVECFPDEKSPKSLRITFLTIDQPMMGAKGYLPHGQKMTYGTVTNQEDMPYIENGPDSGCTVDLCLSPCAILRVTIGLLLDMLIGTARLHNPALLSQFHTLFLSEKDMMKRIQLAIWILKEHGLNDCGKQMMRSGTTGILMEAFIFSGFVPFHILNKNPSDKLRGRDYGPIVELTRQPTSCIMTPNSAIKLSEMDSANLHAWGATGVHANMHYHVADKYQLLYCERCQVDALGERKGFHLCNVCKKKDALVEIRVPYISKLLQAEGFCGGIGLRYVLK